MGCSVRVSLCVLGMLLEGAALESPRVVRNRTCRFDGPLHPKMSEFNADVHCFERFAFCGYANCSLSSDLPSLGKSVALCGCAAYGGTAKTDKWDGIKAGLFESQLGLQAGAPPAFKRHVNSTMLAMSQRSCPHGVKSCGLAAPKRVAPICEAMNFNPGALWPGFQVGSTVASELAAIGLKGPISYLSTSSQCTRPIPDDRFEPMACGPPPGQPFRSLANCMLGPCYTAEFDGGPAGTWPVTCVCPVEHVDRAMFGLKDACASPDGFVVSGVSTREREQDPSAWDWHRNESSTYFGNATAYQVLYA